MLRQQRHWHVFHWRQNGDSVILEHPDDDRGGLPVRSVIVLLLLLLLLLLRKFNIHLSPYYHIARDSFKVHLQTKEQNRPCESYKKRVCLGLALMNAKTR